MAACGLDALPDRRTFDRRFKIMPVRDVICQKRWGKITADKQQDFAVVVTVKHSKE
jgi:hypothetical protein